MINEGKILELINKENAKTQEELDETQATIDLEESKIKIISGNSKKKADTTMKIEETPLIQKEKRDRDRKYEEIIIEN